LYRIVFKGLFQRRELMKIEKDIVGVRDCKGYRAWLLGRDFRYESRESP
jgi:hypothetical protein